MNTTLKLFTFFLHLITFIKSEDFSSITNSSLARVKLYVNSAEIAYKISAFQFPVEFSPKQLEHIRPETIRLNGKFVHVSSQTITQQKKSLNGQKVLICKDDCSNTVEAIMIDDEINLVKDLSDNTYYTVLYSQTIKYFDIPPTNKIIVDFTFETSNIEQLYLQMISNQLKWRTIYDLLLDDNDTLLIGYADMQNSGLNAVQIEQAELFGGDINIRGPSQTSYNNEYYQSAGSGNAAAGLYNDVSYTTMSPTHIGQELAGVYLFTIDKPFIIDAKSNYLLPIIRSTIEIERYGSIRKYFQITNNNGNAQRSYRLKSDQFLLKGNVLVRENNRLVGETMWTDQAANNSYIFSIGQDPDIIYSETIMLLTNESSKSVENSQSGNIPNGNIGYVYTVNTTYEITLNLKNFKERSVLVEYMQDMTSRLFIFPQQTNDFKRDGSIIAGNFTLQSKEIKELKYKIILQLAHKYFKTERSDRPLSSIIYVNEGFIVFTIKYDVDYDIPQYKDPNESELITRKNLQNLFKYHKTTKKIYSHLDLTQFDIQPRPWESINDLLYYSLSCQYSSQVYKNFRPYARNKPPKYNDVSERLIFSKNYNNASILFSTFKGASLKYLHLQQHIYERMEHT
ncbi:unnamed protein product [Didymodactylos carnosus]|uniref:Uncharacterized protein n=2 Tax=Didymodactylos carnosus TaxID=1234261 RepID=A0A814B9H5_9BILA|nr:unnamed protein product [Didymodactylos carnosus]CAF3702908.1 unnamed protein product [Didymodactylos carnosus]